MRAPPDPFAEHLRQAWERAADAPDSIRAPSKREPARIEFHIVPISQVGAAGPAAWLWEGYLAGGHATLLSAYAKSGKTTLLTHLLKQLAAGGGLIGDPRYVRVLVVTEESGLIWRRRHDELGLDDRVHLCQRPFRGKPTHGDWQRLVAHLAGAVRAEGYGLVVIDTLAHHWPVINENDASEVTAALAPLHELTDAGAALLLQHHARKADAGEGQAGRGSGALIGFVDIVLELRRYQAQEPADRRRVLTGYSRFDETPHEAVLELTGDGYVLLGDRGAAGRLARMAVINGILGGAGDPLRPDDVRGRWPGQNKPGKRVVEEDMAWGASQGALVRTGSGTRNSPYRYSVAPGFNSRTTTLSGAGIESGPPQRTPQHDLNHRNGTAPVCPGEAERPREGGR